MFVLNSDIMIGNFRFSGVRDARINRSLHSIVDTAVITVPSMARIQNNRKLNPNVIVTGKQFKEGDPVIIRLGYNGEMQTEFKGFVSGVNKDMPLQITCEGYSWLLRRNNVNKFWATISLKELLQEALSDIPAANRIDLKCEVDLQFSNVVANNICGFEIISNISTYSDGSLACFFIQPDVLWCGYVYSPFAMGVNPFAVGTAGYRLGYNLIRENNLEERNVETTPVKVAYSKRLSRGVKISQTSDVFKNFRNTRVRILNHIVDARAMKLLANEKAYLLSYTGYEGTINGFLQPYVTPGFLAYLRDDRYPENNGNYLVEGTEIHVGINGARRIVEIGPKIGFAKK